MIDAYAGRQRIPWRETLVGQEVWIDVARYSAEPPHITGPFAVAEPRTRILRNQDGSTFLHWTDNLIGYPLEFQGQLPLPDGLAQDCRVCLQMHGWEKIKAMQERTGITSYHMPSGTVVVALEDGYYAHAVHSPEEIREYSLWWRERAR